MWNILRSIIGLFSGPTEKDLIEGGIRDNKDLRPKIIQDTKTPESIIKEPVFKREYADKVLRETNVGITQDGNFQVVFGCLAKDWMFIANNCLTHKDGFCAHVEKMGSSIILHLRNTDKLPGFDKKVYQERCDKAGISLIVEDD